MKIKIDNFEIYKLKQAGLSNQQVLKVLQYGEIYDPGIEFRENRLKLRSVGIQ